MAEQYWNEKLIESLKGFFDNRQAILKGYEDISKSCFPFDEKLNQLQQAFKDLGEDLKAFDPNFALVEKDLPYGNERDLAQIPFVKNSLQHLLNHKVSDKQAQQALSRLLKQIMRSTQMKIVPKPAYYGLSREELYGISLSEEKIIFDQLFVLKEKFSENKDLLVQIETAINLINFGAWHNNFVLGLDLAQKAFKKTRDEIFNIKHKSPKEILSFNFLSEGYPKIFEINLKKIDSKEGAAFIKEMKKKYSWDDPLKGNQIKSFLEEINGFFGLEVFSNAMAHFIFNDKELNIQYFDRYQQPVENGFEIPSLVGFPKVLLKDDFFEKMRTLEGRVFKHYCDAFSKLKDSKEIPADLSEEFNQFLKDIISEYGSNGSFGIFLKRFSEGSSILPITFKP